ncbi:transglycosylase SLT domain-containing protein [Pseudoalteromonas distincta]|uniref:transglycosylase SLT domain-containing protein n=1 Tax=Pseudoalteromonas distincta TaxID=77608 RepID=UPI002340FBED|nr:transglycosylase SLT domain-containing protein [Pseudoalteromonas distincta]MDC3211681.1 transglycosylase SLT domain-containing protein [Pseudoalteromonas distincta]
MNFFKVSKYIPLITILSLPAQDVNSQQTHDPFAELEREIEAQEKEGSLADIEAFKIWKNTYLSEYQQFRQQNFQKQDNIRDQLINIWGETDPQKASALIYYSPDNKSKTIVDYEKNEVRISVLHDTAQIIDSTDVVDVFEEAIKSGDLVNEANPLPSLQNIESTIRTNTKVLEKKTDFFSNPQRLLEKEIDKIKKQSKTYKQEVEKIIDMEMLISKSATVEPIVVKQIQSELKKIDIEERIRIKKLKAANSNIDTKKKREALKNKKVTTYTMPLRHANFIQKAKLFRVYVSQYAQRWELPESLLFSIIHTESHFNTKAQSSIPAFGLMQIVPTSSGLDVNRFLHSKEEIMTKEYLFKPVNNIETGIAYMHLLNSKYLAKISDPQSRLYCMIASYNTGAGNVARTFNSDNSRNINKAANIINMMTPSDVYKKLISDLPYKETQQYLEKVVSRQSIYKSMDNI